MSSRPHRAKLGGLGPKKAAIPILVTNTAGWLKLVCMQNLPADKIKTFLTPGTYEKRVMGDDRTAAEAHWADCPQ